MVLQTERQLTDKQNIQTDTEICRNGQAQTVFTDWYRFHSSQLLF